MPLNAALHSHFDTLLRTDLKLQGPGTVWWPGSPMLALAVKVCLPCSPVVLASVMACGVRASTMFFIQISTSATLTVPLHVLAVANELARRPTPPQGLQGRLRLSAGAQCRQQRQRLLAATTLDEL